MSFGASCCAEVLGFGQDTPEAEDHRTCAARRWTTQPPDLGHWLPLLGAVFDIEVAPTPEVELLAEANRSTNLHENSARGTLETMLPDKLFVEIDDVHHMDKASAQELLTHLSGVSAARPWLFALGRRPLRTRFEAAEAPEVVRIDLKPITPQDALRLAQLGDRAEFRFPAHVLNVDHEAVRRRPAGLLRDLLRTAISIRRRRGPPRVRRSSRDTFAHRHAGARRPGAGSLGGGLRPDVPPRGWCPGSMRTRTVRRPTPRHCRGCMELLEEGAPTGSRSFGTTLLRDSAYEGLPSSSDGDSMPPSRRISNGNRFPEEAVATLSLHYLEAGDYRQAWNYATAAAKRAGAVYAYVEAAGLYGRALEAGRQTPTSTVASSRTRMKRSGMRGT